METAEIKTCKQQCFGGTVSPLLCNSKQPGEKVCLGTMLNYAKGHGTAAPSHPTSNHQHLLVFRLSALPSLLLHHEAQGQIPLAQNQANTVQEGKTS